MHTLTQDIRYALRQLRSAPGFTLTAVLTLALGIGATTAIFTLVYQVMLRNIPVQHPKQLYKLGKDNDCCVTGGVPDQWNLFNYDLYRELRDRTPGIEGMAAVDSASNIASVRREGKPAEAQPLAIRFVSGNYFPLLGVHDRTARRSPRRAAGRRDQLRALAGEVRGRPYARGQHAAAQRQAGHGGRHRRAQLSRRAQRKR
jgi:hypothetical protein